MMRPIGYLRDFGDYLGRSWNEFWFRPTDVTALCWQRCAIGVVAVIWQLSFTPDLIQWFGPNGWLDPGLYHSWVVEDLTPAGADATPRFAGRISYLFVQSPAVLTALHFGGTVILVAFAVGLGGRISNLLSWFVLLAYVHRAPFLGGPAELVLTMVVGYLCFAPTSAAFALRLRRREHAASPSLSSSWATIARRLIQVHLAAIYLAMFMTKLVSPTWWNGEAVWWVYAQQLTQTVDLTFLRANLPWLNLWTFGVLLMDFSMFTLVWNRRLRPLVLSLSALSWVSIAVASGQAGLSLTMMAASLAFLEGHGRYDESDRSTDHVVARSSHDSSPEQSVGEASHAT